MLWLKSSAALPKYMRIIRKDAKPTKTNFSTKLQCSILYCVPTRKEEIPIQAEARCTIGFSQTFPAFPIRCRNEIPVNMMKKMTENPSDIARNAGATVGGAAKTELGVSGVNTDVSIATKPYSYLQTWAMKRVHTVKSGD